MSLDSISTPKRGWSYDPCNGETHHEWLLVTTNTGFRGWTNQPNEFDGSDRISGDDMSGTPAWVKKLDAQPPLSEDGIYEAVLYPVATNAKTARGQLTGKFETIHPNELRCEGEFGRPLVVYTSKIEFWESGCTFDVPIAKDSRKHTTMARCSGEGHEWLETFTLAATLDDTLEITSRGRTSEYRRCPE